VDLKDIKAIIDLMRKNSLSEFELEKEGFKIRLRRGSGHPGAVAPGPYYEDPPGASPAGAPMLSLSAAAPLPKPAAPPEAEIKSPMIGTMYRAPSPDSAPYVDVGSEVGPETVVCIIEAMKVMNEIKAEARGIITQALVENAKPVEFGQPLFKIRPI
jgi:acetyl-CoA carboxylase biotin carboxyl carrier protein